MSREKLLRALLEDDIDEVEAVDQEQDPCITQKLSADLVALSVKGDFKPGDVIRWKVGFKNKQPGGPFIVINALDEPVFDQEKGAGSPYFREPLDLEVGFRDSDGDFLIVFLDSRRLEVIEETDKIIRFDA